MTCLRLVNDDEEIAAPVIGDESPSVSIARHFPEPDRWTMSVRLRSGEHAVLTLPMRFCGREEITDAVWELCEEMEEMVPLAVVH